MLETKDMAYRTYIYNNDIFLSFTFAYGLLYFHLLVPIAKSQNFPICRIIAERYVIPAMFQHNDYTTDVWLLKLSEQQDPFRFRMHAQRVCIIAAYPVLRLCDASNIAALSAHDVSNTELPHEFAPSTSLRPHGNSVHNAPEASIYPSSHSCR